MITFRTHTAIGMEAVMRVLHADGNPAQLVGRYRKVATTTADRDSLRAAARFAAVRIFIERTGLEHRTHGGVSQAIKS